MGILGFGRSHIPYDMFEMARSAAEARRYTKCENIYHKGQELAWDGKEILPMLIEKHGGPQIDGDQKESLKRLFAIIMWGELAAWKISAQLADRLEPLEAKMAATSQAHDEARHFYTMYDYLKELDYLPEKLDPAPQALLDLVLGTDVLVHKLVGMQLMIESIALAIFQEVRELEPEPVLAELMQYYERDEARHVGLGMQYLPEMMQRMSRLELLRMSLFQARLIGYALWENKVLEKDFEKLGIDPRRIIERARSKQMVAVAQAFEAMGWDVETSRGPVMSAINAIIELTFPTDATHASLSGRAQAAWRALRSLPEVDEQALDVHARHRIKTARGKMAEGEPAGG